MDRAKIRWLIGAKIVCCGGLFLVLSGVVSLATIGAFVTGNALPLAAAGGTLALVAWLVAARRRAARVTARP